MKKLLKLLTFIFLIVSIYGCMQNTGISLPIFPTSITGSKQLLEDAFNNQKSDVQVEGKGIVTKILTDDLNGSKHQRFIIKLSSEQTLLIAHNIDIAPRINSLKEGDLIKFYGEYEWNDRGGIVHWTHDDPHENHIGGWIEHNGKRYQ